MSAAVVRTVGLATMQDGGRRGFTDVGVPVSGAWHRARYLLAVALVTGRLDDRVPAVEVLGGVLELDVSHEWTVAVTGPAQVDVDDRVAPADTCLVVPAGARLRVRHQGPGPCYVVLDGLEATGILGSVATDTFSGLGPRPLAVGDRLRGEPGRHVTRVGAFLRERPESRGPLVMIATPEVGRLGDATGWVVTSVARSGVRMRGPEVVSTGDVPSAPMLPGAVQVTPAGEAVILGPDGGLTGGYPVVGVIASADLDRVSVLAPGDHVSFQAVTVADASARWAAHERSLRTLVRHVGPVL